MIHKGNSLNGRIIIYDLLPSVISQRFLLGYGYNSSIITIILGYGNAQNGLFQCILDLGIIGTVVFLINWYKCINIKFDNKNWALYCWLYSFMICSLVEVCLKFNFFMVLCILFNVGLLQKKEKIN